MTVLCLAACAEGGRQVGTVERTGGTFMGLTREDACESAGVTSGFPERVSAHRDRVSEIAVKPLRSGSLGIWRRVRSPHFQIGEVGAPGHGAEVHADFSVPPRRQQLAG